MKDTVLATRCVYCLEEKDQILSDNIFGHAWQGQVEDDITDRWQIPACLDCKNKFDKIEHDFLIRVGRLFAPVELKLLGIPPEVDDFISAKTDDIRKGISEKSTPDEVLFRQIVRGANISQDLVKKAINLPAYENIRSIKWLGAKFIRGLFYRVNFCHIESNHKLEIYFKHELNAKPVLEAMENLGCQTYCGLGVKIVASFANDDPQSGIFELSIWDNMKLYAFCQ